MLSGRRFSNQFDIMLETPYSCDTVGRELKRALLLFSAPVNRDRLESSRR